MRLIVANTTEPGEVGVDVIPQLAPKFSVMDVNSRAELTALAGLVQVLEPEPANGFTVSYAW